MKAMNKIDKFLLIGPREGDKWQRPDEAVDIERYLALRILLYLILSSHTIPSNLTKWEHEPYFALLHEYQRAESWEILNFSCHVFGFRGISNYFYNNLIIIGSKLRHAIFSIVSQSS